ncbi:MAG: glycosyltransferase [Methanomassiliicoccus sp.]|nr:glycosyltransferase [Methanomassiliicoccus sp.]
MTIVLVRGRENDSAVFRYFNSLHDRNIGALLVMWNRETSEKRVEKKYDIIDINIKSPTDTIAAIFFLPFWWLFEFFKLLKLKPSVIGAFDVDTAIPALLVSKIFRSKLTYIMLDYSPDCLPHGTPFFIKRFMEIIERFMLREADKIVIVDESRIDQIGGNDFIEKIHIVHNIPLNANKIQDTNNIRINNDDNINIFYAGILHETRGLVWLINSILKTKHVFLTVAGKGPLEGYVAEKALENPNKISYVGQIDHDEVMRYTMESDAIIGFYDPTIRNNKYASPNRFFEAMICSKPLITNKGTSIADIIERYNSGYLIDYGDENTLSELITQIFHNKGELLKRGDNAKHLINSKYSIEKENRVISDVFSYAADSRL